MKLLLLLIFSLIVVSCAETGSSSSGKLVTSCSGITCSGHGVCKSDDGILGCECESGYISTGSECLFDCSGVENSVISIYNNSCECKPGLVATKNESGVLISCGCDEGKVYVNSICLTKCDDENASPIGINQTCVCNEGYFLNIDGICTFDCRDIYYSYTNSANNGCDCDENYEKNNNRCEYSCNKAGNMIANSFNTGCECKDGYFEAGVDVCANPCDGISCGENEACKAQNSESYTCKCDYGRKFNFNFNYKEVTYVPWGIEDFSIASNNGESYAVVWSANTSDTDFKKSIYVTLLDSEGNVTKSTFIVNSNVGGDKITPSIVWGGDSYLVAWVDLRYDNDDFSVRDVFFRLIKENGDLTAETRLTFTANNNSFAAWKPKILWNKIKSHYAIFWQERKRDIDNNLGVVSVYYRIIKPGGNFEINAKITTPASIYVHDFDVVEGKDNNYSMIWVDKDDRSKVYAQTLSSDYSVINNSGVLLSQPINIVHTPMTLISYPKIIWNTSGYGVFFRNQIHMYFILLDENNHKLQNSIDLNTNHVSVNIFWDGAEYIFFSRGDREVYGRKISWDGKIVNNHRLSDGLLHNYEPRFTLTDSGIKAFWLDDRNQTFDLYFSKLGCY